MESLTPLLSRFRKQNLLQTAILIITISLSVGCSKKPELTGRWENTTVQEFIEFKSDKSGIIQGKNLPPLTFTWKEIANNSYTLDVNFQGQKKGLKAVLQDTNLVLEGDGGKESYRKIPTK